LKLLIQSVLCLEEYQQLTLNWGNIPVNATHFTPDFKVLGQRAERERWLDLDTRLASFELGLKTGWAICRI